jgi:hypothetical protein
MNIVKILFAVFSLLSNIFATYAQTASKLENEVVLLSFETEQGKSIGLYLDKLEDALFCKLETDQTVDLQYPEKVKKNKNAFTYSYYFRGGGSANEGLELNFVYFIVNDIKYILYETSHYSELKKCIGLKVINLNSTQTDNYKAKDGTVNGTLVSLRESNLVLKGEELFD